MGVGGQTNRLQARQAGEDTQDIRMSMNRPVVLDNEDTLGARLSVVNQLINLSDLPTPDKVVIQVVHLSAQRIQRANQPPVLAEKPVRGFCGADDGW